jgi:hypothetical protein
LPVEGKLSLKIAPSEIDAKFRDELFGGLMANPPLKSLMTLETVMRGNLTKTLEGDGMITLSSLTIGRSKEGHLPFAGEVPLRLKLADALQSPSIGIDTSEASLRLGQGKWMGSVQIRYAGGRLETVSRGSVSGVRIEEMLAAFTSTPDIIDGLAEIPEYLLRSGGQGLSRDHAVTVRQRSDQSE